MTGIQNIYGVISGFCEKEPQIMNDGTLKGRLLRSFIIKKGSNTNFKDQFSKYLKAQGFQNNSIRVLDIAFSVLTASGLAKDNPTTNYALVLGARTLREIIKGEAND